MNYDELMIILSNQNVYYSRLMFDDYSISHGFNDPLRWWPSERSNMFTDAVFSIISTVLVVTIKITEEDLAEVFVQGYHNQSHHKS